MEAYTSFAEVYDIFMDNVPYSAWADYLQELLIEYKIDKGLILDLGCGTGTLTRHLAKMGYDMIGVDNSEEMLSLAIEKQRDDQKASHILYLLQDMRSFELYGTVRGIVSVCDSLNYITSEKELLEVFSLANNYLDPGGMFIFDFNTTYKYEYILSTQTIAENREEASFIWENFYDSEEQINEYDLTLFVRNQQGLYQKFEETHYQKAYSLATIKELISSSGLKFVTAYDAFTRESPTDKSERICVIAKEQEK